jgi:hypothetical protein
MNDVVDVAVVQQTINDRGGDHRVAEDRTPLADAASRRSTGGGV